MRSIADRAAVEELLAEGCSSPEISRRTGIPLSTVRKWRRRLAHGCQPRAAELCRTCGAARHEPKSLPPADYAYLLGLYLGDGHIALHRRGVHRLGISLDRRYPAIVDGCARAMRSVMPGRSVLVQGKPGCFLVSSYSKSWPCLLPQHGPGRKHERPIVLADWQQRLVEAHPEPLLRGLIHSDGWRGTNRVVRRGRRYDYPRYTFTNVSPDIRRLFCATCDGLGIAWRPMTRYVISIARRDAVARLDEFVGPKR